jgi:lauroyl/myristoyl acyltransferase
MTTTASKASIAGTARYWAFHIAAAIIPRIPFQVARPAAVGLGWLLWLLAGSARQRVARNLAHVPHLAGHPEALQRATRGVFVTMTLNYLDFFRGASLTDQQITAGWTIINQEAFDAAMAQGHGAVIVSGHFGNFEFAASRLGAIGHKLIIPAERMRPEALYRLFCALREHHGLRIVPADSRDSVRDLLDALKHNEVVMFLADRHVNGSSVEVPFFGSPARLPSAPMALALRSGAPVFTAYSWRTGVGRQTGVFIPLDLAAATGIPEGAGQTKPVRGPEATARAIRLFVEELERQVAAHPDQWVAALSPIWKEG